MQIPLKDLAIKKALENNWQEAHDVNKEILKENPDDIDALNRLAFSLMRLGKYKQAKETYKKVIAIDSSNPIALKNLKKVEAIIKQGPEPSSKNGKTSSKNGQDSKGGFSVNFEDLFIEEAGKTKIVDLKNITDKKTLSFLQPGDYVFLLIKRSKIFVQSENNRYIGMLPDNIGTRLIPFIKGGNEYQACVRSTYDQGVSIFIKEIKKSTKFKNQSSFSSSSLLFREVKENSGEDE